MVTIDGTGCTKSVFWNEDRVPVFFKKPAARPQAPPSAGNIERAEKIIEELGMQKSLERRFARLEEIEAVWMPEQKPKEDAPSGKTGIFSHLMPKEKAVRPQMEMPPVVMTWKKFSETVLPSAEYIEYFVGDKKENYLPIGGISTGCCKVTAVCYTPSMWHGGGYSHHSKAVFFLLEGAKDKRHKNAGNALFPEILKTELREIRAAIEAYSKSALLGNYEEASACGIKLEYGAGWEAVFRVTAGTGTVVYQLDRRD